MRRIKKMNDGKKRLDLARHETSLRIFTTHIAYNTCNQDTRLPEERVVYTLAACNVGYFQRCLCLEDLSVPPGTRRFRFVTTHLDDLSGHAAPPPVRKQLKANITPSKMGTDSQSRTHT